VLGAALSRSQIFGRVAYVGDKPASGALAFPTITLYTSLGWRPRKRFRGLGLPELVIKACLDDAKKVTLLERTFLHATADGIPRYLRMGYRPLAGFPFYGPR
jgi:hypothetical protein